MSKDEYLRAKERYARACELCDKYIDLANNETEQGEYILSLSEDDKTLLEEEFWDRQPTIDAARYLAKQLVTPNKKKLGIATATGVGSAGVGYALGQPIGTIAAMGLGGFLLGDVLVTILEEDAATKRLAAPIRRFLDKQTQSITNKINKLKK